MLEDNELREAIKSYSDWPTLPQLYVNVSTFCRFLVSSCAFPYLFFDVNHLLLLLARAQGEFVGGCDIVMGMFASGELHKLLGKQPPAAAAEGAKAK